MMKRLVRSAAIIGASVALLTGAARADAIIDWNLKTLELTRAAQTPGSAQARTLALVHVAMSDAVNSVRGRFTRYNATVAASPAASAEAAAASAARKVLNAIFLYHCVKAGLDMAIIHPSHVVPLGEIPAEERELAEDLIFYRRPDALQRYIEHFEGRVETLLAMTVPSL